MIIQDISAYCEFDQLVACNMWDFTNYPNISAWIQRMRVRLHSITITYESTLLTQLVECSASRCSEKAIEQTSCNAQAEASQQTVANTFFI